MVVFRLAQRQVVTGEVLVRTEIPGGGIKRKTICNGTLLLLLCSDLLNVELSPERYW